MFKGAMCTILIQSLKERCVQFSDYIVEDIWQEWNITRCFPHNFDRLRWLDSPTLLEGVGGSGYV